MRWQAADRKPTGIQQRGFDVLPGLRAPYWGYVHAGSRKTRHAAFAPSAVTDFHRRGSPKQRRR
eukprot:15465875-Alexandrium_andersonii.AAC.1